MLEYDIPQRLMSWKIVYYGPALSGKTTNLLTLHDQLSSHKPGRMMQADTKQDRTLFFDLLPLSCRTCPGVKLKIKVSTVPGQVHYNATRKSALTRADGIVFVADSRRSQMLHNSESFAALEYNCKQVGLPFDRLPLVIQFNKRDLPASTLTSEKEILPRWRKAGVPVFFASARNGYGVSETFRDILSRVATAMNRRPGMMEEFRVSSEELIGFLIGRKDPADKAAMAMTRENRAG